MSDSTTSSRKSRSSQSVETAAGGERILLETVTKQYPGQNVAAVGNITLEIPAGKIVMLVGPSGCGKTTTLKMINRLIEPTEGRIMLGDQDVTDINGDTLRRQIGYVIQAGGLFPHMSVETNIGLVPKMLGWDKERISKRVDELLELVSMDPKQYRKRYPRELSGGQQQRVGVARGLAADPPVLLMDEPFGAVDPITRQRLQDELLNIQADLHKTIVIVTHDFDEAVKLGDWIVVFGENAQVVQYDTPDRILAHPTNDYVANFIGSGAGLKQLTLQRVRDVPLAEPMTAKAGDDARELRHRARESKQNHVVIVDDNGRPVRWPTVEELRSYEKVPSGRDDKSLAVVSNLSTLNDALDTMLSSSSAGAIVTGRHEELLGVINVETVMEAIVTAREDARKKADLAPVGTNEIQAVPEGAAR